MTIKQINILQKVFESEFAKEDRINKQKRLKGIEKFWADREDSWKY